MQQVASNAPTLVQQTSTGTVHQVEGEEGERYLEIREPYDDAAHSSSAPPPLHRVTEEEEVRIPM